MGNFIINEAWNTLKEQDLNESNMSQIKDKVKATLEDFYYEKVVEFMGNESITAQEVAEEVSEYNADWCPDEYTNEQQHRDEMVCERIVNLLVAADTKTLFANASM